MEGEGPPAGRTDPGSGLSSRIGPLPLWGWLLAFGGILAFFLWRNSQSSSSPTDLTGSASNTPSDTGVGNTNLLDPNQPITMADLQQALAQLYAEEAANAPKGNGIPYKIPKVPHITIPKLALSDVTFTGIPGLPDWYTARLNGGWSTNQTATPGVPLLGTGVWRGTPSGNADGITWREGDK